MTSKLNKSDLLASLASELSSVKTTSELLLVKSRFLGKDSVLASVSTEMRLLSAEEKKRTGVLLNEVRTDIEALIRDKQDQLDNATSVDAGFDASMPGVGFSRGHIHPVVATIQKLENIFIKAGFQVIDGPEIELDYYNFTALNIPENHPVRDNHDTFYLSEHLLLRTHTSNVQIRTMEESPDLPLCVISTGKVYRKDYDNTHTPMFHQMEGLCVGENINIGNLIHCLKGFLQEFFQQEVNLRIRPSYFPFTEPSIEVDIGCIFCSDGCSYCKGSNFIEILGAGMVHPNVLSNLGFSADKVSGFAFGLGIERVASLHHKINDIRKFYEGTFDFIRQF